MNKSVANYISELLFLHDCVIVPEFGGFVGNRKSAQLNKTTGSLTPPSKQILFNINLSTNDGLLITHIANQEGVTQKIAKKHVELFANESNTKLSTSKILRIEKIGLFIVGKEGHIVFSQDATINYNLDTFGMQPTYSKSIDRKNETEVKAAIQKIKPRIGNPKILLQAAAVIIPLVALSYLSIFEQERISSIYIQMATFNPFAKKEIAKEIIIPKTEKKLKPTPIIVEPTKPIEGKPITTAILQKDYYIIAGAFAEEKYAKEMLERLKKWGYNSTIIKEEKLMRVSYDTFISRDEAILALNKIKQENPEAWLFTK